jgi:hypothetical protein
MHLKINRFIQTAFIFLLLVVNMKVVSAQIKITETEIIGNWVVTGGSGQEFEKEMIGQVITFKKEHKAQRMENEEMLEAEWKFENNVITFTTHYKDGINDPEVETLTITQFDGKKLTANYTDDDNAEFIIILERAKMP